MSETAYVRSVAAHCRVDPGVVEDILTLSRQRRFVYHGIGMSTVLDDVRQAGIWPREARYGGPEETEWSSGRCLFSGDGNLPESAHRSTFFYDAHNKDGMSLAISSPNDLSICRRRVEDLTPGLANLGNDDATFVLRDFLPAGYYAFLHVNLPDTTDASNPGWSQRVGMAGEAKMMRLLLETLKKSNDLAGYQKTVTIDHV